jgi:uncharacterized membrane protein
MRSRYLKILAGVVLGLGAVFLIFTSTTRCVSVNGAGEVRIDVSSLIRGTARMFCYTDDAGAKLRFVLARGNDGNVRSVFDACRQCFTYHRGYQLVAGELICRVCGNHYAIGNMSEGKASCVPASLPHDDAANLVRIKTADLRAGRSLF